MKNRTWVLTFKCVQQTERAWNSEHFGGICIKSMHFENVKAFDVILADINFREFKWLAKICYLQYIVMWRHQSHDPRMCFCCYCGCVLSSQLSNCQNNPNTLPKQRPWCNKSPSDELTELYISLLSNFDTCTNLFSSPEVKRILNLYLGHLNAPTPRVLSCQSHTLLN